MSGVKFLRLLLLSFPAVLCGCDSARQSQAEVGASVPATDALFAERDMPGFPGCALAVARRGQVVYSRGYGSANLDYDIAITPQTIFDVGSVTKQFTAASLSLLALDGRLSLDDDVRNWLPELPQYESPITLRHLVHHTSGLRDYLNLFPLAGRGEYFPITHAQILAMMSRQKSLVFPPGEQYLYSNTGYMLLAQVIERASGMSLGEFTRKRIFELFGMASSLMYEDKEAIIPRRATGYVSNAAGGPRIVHNYNFDIAGDGQLYTTMGDLLIWDHYLHGANKPAIHEMMLTDGTLNSGESIGYAQGLVLDEYRGLRTIGHSGSSWGFRTQLLRFDEPELTIAISCNDGSAEPGRLARQVAEHYLAGQLGPLPEDSDANREEAAIPANEDFPELASDTLRQYVGEYFSVELDATYRFSLQDDALVLRIEQEPAIAVRPTGVDALAIDFDQQSLFSPWPASLDFTRGGAGEITGFRLTSGSEVGIVFDRRR